MSNAVTYDAARRRIISLVTNGDPAAAVQACPGWTVKDVVAHLAGGLGDFVNRRFEGHETGAWGEKQVEERRDRALGELLVEWERNFEISEGLFDSPVGAVLVAEIVQHEHDIRAALGRPGSGTTSPSARPSPGPCRSWTSGCASSTCPPCGSRWSTAIASSARASRRRPCGRRRSS
nr:hypothetical protein GCM10017745_03010 [Saccharothrix mutabilis subsp. capreolus]